MMFIKLTGGKLNNEIYINPNLIAVIEPREKGGCLIFFTGIEGPLSVKEDIQVIKTLLHGQGCRI